MKIKDKKGLILLQVIVVIVVLGFLTVAILKFTLGRHGTVSRAKRNIDAKVLIEACMAKKTTEWADTAPTSGGCSIDVKGTLDTSDDVWVSVSVLGSQVPYQITYSVDYGDVGDY